MNKEEVKTRQKHELISAIMAKQLTEDGKKDKDSYARQSGQKKAKDLLQHISRIIHTAARNGLNYANYVQKQTQPIPEIKYCVECLIEQLAEKGYKVTFTNPNWYEPAKPGDYLVNPHIMIEW